MSDDPVGKDARKIHIVAVTVEAERQLDALGERAGLDRQAVVMLLVGLESSVPRILAVECWRYQMERGSQTQRVSLRFPPRQLAQLETLCRVLEATPSGVVALLVQYEYDHPRPPFVPASVSNKALNGSGVYSEVSE